jgi:cell division protein FtsB
MPVRNWIITTILALLIGFALYALAPAYARYRETRETMYEMKDSLRRQEAELAALKKELASLRTDYRAIERVARERFGLCREDEEIYHFETPPARPGDSRKNTPRSRRSP